MTSPHTAERPISPFLVLAGLTALVILAYGGTLRNGFTFDDQAIIVKNSLIKRVEHWPALLTSDYWAGGRDPGAAPTIRAGLYRPLVLLSFAVNHAVAGLTPWSYHLVNVLLHLGVTWLLYLVARRLGFSQPASLIAAILFAVHPIHTEAVAGVVGRAELLMSVGVLAGLLWGIGGRLWLSLTALLLALLSKEQAVMLPVLVLLYDFTVGRTMPASHSRKPEFHHLMHRYGPYVLLVAAYGVLRGLILGHLSPPPTPFLDNPLPHLDWWPRLLTTIKVAGHYLRLFLWPDPLSADYSYQAISVAHSLLDGGVLFGLLAWAGLLALAVVSSRRSPRVCFAVGFLLVTFLPVSNLLLPIGTIMGERLFYLPSAGLCLLCAAGFGRIQSTLVSEGGPVTRKPRFPRARAGVLVLFIGLSLALLLRTMFRVQDWADDDQLAQSLIRVVPHSAKAHSIAGRIAKDKGQWNEAIDQFQAAVSLYPDYLSVDPTLNSNMGIALIESGRMAEGVAALERAVALEPRWSLPLYNLGFAYTKQGRNREAEGLYRAAANLNAEDPKPHTGLGFLFLSEQRYEDALSAAEEALRRDLSYVEAQYVKAEALKALGGSGAPPCPPGILRC